MIYGYLKNLVGKLVIDYKLYNPIDLKCFIKIIP